MPFDHTSLFLPSASFDPFVAFLLRALAPLQLEELVRIPFPNGQSIVGLGERSGIRDPRVDAYFWIGVVPQDLEEAQAKIVKLGHTAFVASDRKQVDAFHAAALEAGALDDGAPGAREHPMYPQPYYAAFVKDPVCGIKIEVVCRAEESK